MTPTSHRPIPRETGQSTPHGAAMRAGSRVLVPHLEPIGFDPPVAAQTAWWGRRGRSQGEVAGLL
jgi:hypothetical protein